MSLGLLGLFWPVHRFVRSDRFSFEHAFAPGDLLFFSALLPMGVAVQVKLYNLDLGKRKDCLRLRGRSLVRGDCSDFCLWWYTIPLDTYGWPRRYEFTDALRPFEPFFSLFVSSASILSRRQKAKTCSREEKQV